MGKITEYGFYRTKNNGDTVYVTNIWFGIDSMPAVINKVELNPVGWTNTSVKIIVNAYDAIGIKGYSFDDGETWQTGNTKEFTDNTDNIKIKVKDYENRITVYNEVINIKKIDKTSPTITEVTGNATNWTKGPVTLTVNATDKDSGIKEYSFDDGSNWQTGNTKQYTANTSNIKIKVRDNAGNEQSYTEVINITKIEKNPSTKRGDANGDGEVNLKDIMAINLHRLGKNILTGSALEFADVTGDRKADIQDMMKINSFRLHRINTL